VVKALNLIPIIVIILVTVGSVLPVAAGPLVDPMRPVNYQRAYESSAAAKKTSVAKDWKLSGILISASRTVAVINGMALQLGGNIDGYRITKITATTAVLKNKHQTLVLHRSGTGLKKSAIKVNLKGSNP